MSDSLLGQAKLWLEQDPDHETREELARLISQQDFEALKDRFENRIGFGTAGLRGQLGAGPNRMNRVLVAQAALGIFNWMQSESEFAGTPLSVVIGFDARTNSDVFARDSAQILAAAGVRVLLFEDFVATPVLAAAVKQGDFSMGIMVTASHNPPRDNGYKVYLGGKNGGSQIISPVDKQIAAHIDAVASEIRVDQIARSNEYEVGGAQFLEPYLFRTAQLVDLDLERAFVSTTYTPMHGVGWATLRELFERSKLPLPAVVNSQLAPDPGFPTLKFPNPEEPGALDEAIKTANRSGSKLIIATDPDADRLGVAIADPSQTNGWRQLTGDEIGLLLAAEIAAKASSEGKVGTLANSIASSSALERVAVKYGLGFTQTLTGFKWISKVPNLIFGYEEALGYCVDPQFTPDKDGISAAIVISDIASRLALEGKTLADQLESLGNQFGHFATSQISFRFSKVETAQEKVAKVRAYPPKTLCGEAVVFEDLSDAQTSENLQLPQTNALRFTLSDKSRVLIRPSGTEPKLKCYLQATADSAADARAKLDELETAMKTLLA